MDSEIRSGLSPARNTCQSCESLQCDYTWFYSEYKHNQLVWTFRVRLATVAKTAMLVITVNDVSFEYLSIVYWCDLKMCSRHFVKTKLSWKQANSLGKGASSRELGKGASSKGLRHLLTGFTLWILCTREELPKTLSRSLNTQCELISSTNVHPNETFALVMVKMIVSGGS